MSISYNEEADYLEIFMQSNRLNYGEDIASGITVFKDEETEEVVGISILNFFKKSRNNY